MKNVNKRTKVWVVLAMLVTVVMLSSNVLLSATNYTDYDGNYSGLYKVDGDANNVVYFNADMSVSLDPTSRYITFTTSVPDGDGVNTSLAFVATNVLVSSVYVKGGDGYRIYTFDPAVESASGLTSPLNNGGNIPGISHYGLALLPVNITPYPIEIIKLDDATELPLPGAKFQVFRDVDGSKVAIGDELTAADPSGIATSAPLAPGDYFVQETFAPDGYVLDSTFHPVTVSFNQTGGKVTITLTNEEIPIETTAPSETTTAATTVETTAATTAATTVATTAATTAETTAATTAATTGSILGAVREVTKATTETSAAATTKTEVLGVTKTGESGFPMTLASGLILLAAFGGVSTIFALRHKKNPD